MRRVIFVVGILLFTTISFAQLSIDAAGTNYTINFDQTVSGVNDGQFAGSGFQPTPTAGQLDSDAWGSTGMSDGPLNFGETRTTGDYARGFSTGGEIDGGFYAFEVSSGDRGLGIQPSAADWTSGTLILRIQNNTGESIISLDVTYDIWVLNNAPRGNKFNFAYSTDDLEYLDVPSMDFVSPETSDPTPVWTSTNRSTTISDFNVANGDYMYLKWIGDDDLGSGNRDEFALDNIVLNATTTNNTIVLFTSKTTTVTESDGSFNLYASIQNSDANPTSVDVVLISGDPADIGNYSTQAIIFPSSSSSDEYITINITDDELLEGLETLTFELQNISGGNSAFIGVPSQFQLRIRDNEIAQLVINEILVDPHALTGDANGDGTVSVTQDEFVEIVNNESSSIDISGWTLNDGIGIRHTFPMSTNISAGQSIVIFGGGTPTGIPGLVHTASTGTLGLNNEGDVISLINSSSFTVATYTYGTEGGEDESLARDPDISGAFVKHLSIVTNSVAFSPGKKNTDGTPLPVELSSFSAVVLENGVKLEWRTETEVSNYGFVVQREVGSRQAAVGNWETLGFVEGNGNSNSPKEYSFIDDLTLNHTLTPTLRYRLKQIDNDGKFEYSKVIEVDLGSPGRFELSQNYPNPFNPVTTIRFSIPASPNLSQRGALVKLIVYNLLGEEVAVLVNQVLEAGVHTINFNASELNSGLYIYKIESNGFVQSKKMTLIK